MLNLTNKKSLINRPNFTFIFRVFFDSRNKNKGIFLFSEAL
nr:MAG TPA: hypothetical protein [Caudoviricetes sp.]